MSVVTSQRRGTGIRWFTVVRPDREAGVASPEFVLLGALGARLAAPSAGTILGVGDDAAVVEVDGTPVAIAVDALVDDVHFDRTISAPSDVGWKAVAVNVSDLAAIGARPRAGVVALHVPDAVDDEEILGIYDGIAEAAQRWPVEIIGGDITASPRLALSVTLIGGLEGRDPMRRSGAVAGDVVVLVGALGQGSAGLALHLAGEGDLLDADPDLLAWHRRPQPNLEAGIALAQTGASACIDVSDGLGRDAGHLARASSVRIVIDEEALPVSPGVVAAAERLGDDLLAVAGGEDYCLLAAVGDDDLARVRHAVGETGSSLSVIGRVEDGVGVGLVRSDRRTVEIDELGYEHAPIRQERRR
jgi:thiamine-monophosphate kinase